MTHSIVFIEPILTGIAGIVGSVIAVFFGAIFMLGRSHKSGRRMIALFPFGIAFQLAPLLYIVLTLRRLSLW